VWSVERGACGQVVVRQTFAGESASHLPVVRGDVVQILDQASRAFPCFMLSWSTVTEIYLGHACSCHAFDAGKNLHQPGLRAHQRGGGGGGGKMFLKVMSVQTGKVGKVPAAYIAAPPPRRGSRVARQARRECVQVRLSSD
jgi:hypothetical protein